MNKKISELDAITTPDSADVFAVVDVSAVATKKITFADLVIAIVGSTTNIKTEVVTAVQSGSDITINTAQLSQTFVVATIVAKNGQMLLPNGSASLPGSSWSISGTIITVYNADEGDSYQVQYIYE